MTRSFELVMPVTTTDHVTGAPGAPVTVVEYGDFECPNCRQAASALQLLLAHFHGGVRLAYRHFPLEGVHTHALQAAGAAECAAAQGAFWKMHDLLFENQLQLELADLRGYAAQLGLDMARFDDDLRGRAWHGRVRQDLDSGDRSGVRSTPGIFINGRIHDVSFGLKSLFDAAADLLEDG